MKRCPCGGELLTLEDAPDLEMYMSEDDYYCVEEDQVLLPHEVVGDEEDECP